MDSRQQAILKTLLYSSLFDYPLTREEIYNFLIGLKISKKECYQLLKNSKLPIEFDEGFFFLRGKGNSVKKRKRREKISLEKFKKAEKIIKKISLIPTVKLIGISGTLAMLNSEKDDDIDLFIIADKNLVWLTRVLAALLLVFLGVYRTRNSKVNADKICLNLLLDEENLKFKDENLFTAHEIMQLIPIFERGGTYQKFIKQNNWIKKFLPNAMVSTKIKFKNKQNIFGNLFKIIAKTFFLETIARNLQLFYMRGHITKEKLEIGFIGLHPLDYKSQVLRNFQRNLKKFQLS